VLSADIVKLCNSPWRTDQQTHVSRAMIKLGARDRAQLVVFAYQAGLVAPRSGGQMPGRQTAPACLTYRVRALAAVLSEPGRLDDRGPRAPA